MDNPRNFAGYGDNCWGLTASDDPDGYKVHEPSGNRDNGIITPTAAISSMPYTPEISLKALKHFYRDLGDKTWGWMGFYDAFNQQRNWWANSYLAIDQGPIIGMIENFRSNLLWNTFMANPEILPMLERIGFRYDPYGIGQEVSFNSGLSIHPNPSNHEATKVEFNLPAAGEIKVEVSNLMGTKFVYYNQSFKGNAGMNHVVLPAFNLSPGLYVLTLFYNNQRIESVKLVIN
ncbi:hypothetical protein MASR1M74_13530 [Lentimicrobium sp.]